MVDKPQSTDSAKPAEQPPAPGTTIPPKRPPGHRSADVRDTVAEMAARAQEISQEAGSKIALAMKDVIGAAAGLVGFTVESARDLVQYMVRRGQMTQEEADRLLREAEEAASKRKPAASAPARQEEAPRPASKPPAPPPAPAAATSKPAAKAPAAKGAAKKPAAAKSAKSATKQAAKKPAAKSTKAASKSKAPTKKR
jgi:polyhydroxyalkanoate synthesis regulator phasin